MPHNNNNKINIELTQEQFFTLLKAVYLGNWVVNACRVGNTEDPRKEEYENLEHYLFSCAKRFGFDEYVDDENAKKGLFFPTRKFEEETDMRQLLEEYDEEMFWDELIDHLGERDLLRQYSKDEILTMSREERFEKLCEHIDKWADEIHKSGIDRLEIKDT